MCMRPRTQTIVAPAPAPAPAPILPPPAPPAMPVALGTPEEEGQFGIRALTGGSWRSNLRIRGASAQSLNTGAAGVDTARGMGPRVAPVRSGPDGSQLPRTPPRAG